MIKTEVNKRSHRKSQNIFLFLLDFLYNLKPRFRWSSPVYPYGALSQLVSFDLFPLTRICQVATFCQNTF